MGAGTCGVLLAHYLLRRAEKYKEVLPQFTLYRRPDAHAVMTLCDAPFPISKTLFFEFIFRVNFARILHKLFPQHFPLFILDLIADTTVSDSGILNLYRGWFTKVKQSNEKILAKLER